MSPMQIALVILTLLAASSFGEEAPIDFKNDLIPVFTKAGCNAGACHGAAVGRGGFKLSLYGGNPAADYEAIVRQLEGRRINLAEPEASLVVLKPTESIEHGGGFLIDFGDESTERLLGWIKQGAKNDSHRSLERLKITPRRIVTKLDEPTTLRATAHFSDGSEQDITRWTIFKAEDSSAVEVDADSAESKVLRRGRHIVVARYSNQVVPIEFVVPLTDAEVDLAVEPLWNFIDEEVLGALESLRLPASPLIDDATFIRRVTLDLTGRLPTAEEVIKFLENRAGVQALARPDADTGSTKQAKADTPAKRAAVVDQLLQSDEFNEYWTLQLAKLLRIRAQVRGQDGDQKQGAVTYHNWLADQLKDDVGYNQLARNVILASGDTHENGPANFYRTVTGPREQAELLSELFMGSRLRCANCHNHPLDRWTQDDYHGLAAIFAKIEGGQIVKFKPRGEVIHPRTLEAAIPRIPGEKAFDRPAIQTAAREDRGAINDHRQQLADWLTDSQNPYFAKAIVNRLWKSMMGRGLVEPADDFRATNPATHPALLDKLAEDFKANGYSLRHTLRLIANSAMYARSANALLENKDDDRFYSHALRKPLEPEVLADAISDVLGVHEQYGQEPDGTRAVALINPKTPSRSLDILGRCGRETSCESTMAAVGGLPQKLHLFNGGLLNARIGDSEGRLGKLLASNMSPMEIIDELYLVALARRPDKNEQRHWNDQLDKITSADEKQVFLEDFVWGLLTSNEFVTNH